MQNSPKTLPPSVKHTLRRDAGSKVTLDVEVDADRLKRAADAAFERHVQRAKIPGFRPGKAPRGMYERAYGKDHLWEDAADDLMDQTYREIVDAEGIEPIDRPDAKLTQLKEGEPLRYTATVVVRPEVALGDYTAHGARVEAAPPSEEEVEKTIASMRDTHAQLRPVDREAKPGDILTVDIDAAVPGQNLPPFARNAHIEAGKDLGIAGLGEALVGLRLHWRRGLLLGAVVAGAALLSANAISYYAGSHVLFLAAFGVYLALFFGAFQVVLWPLVIAERARPVRAVAEDAGRALLRRPVQALVLCATLAIVNLAGLAAASLTTRSA